METRDTSATPHFHHTVVLVPLPQKILELPLDPSNGFLSWSEKPHQLINFKLLKRARRGGLSLLEVCAQASGSVTEIR